jgi:serine/threonine-protein kinase
MTSELFAADYQVLGDLRWDGPSQMLRARHRATGETVTIYVLRQGAPDETAQQFRHEQRVRRKLAHANILATRDMGERAMRPFIVEEYVGDGTLCNLLGSPLPAARATMLVAQVAHGLEHAHDAGIAHCDLHPENIAVAAGGVPKIAGWSRAIDVNEPEDCEPVAIGAMEYLSPEQIRGSSPEKGTDIYALGVLLFTALAGSPPFGPRSFGQIAIAHVLEVPPPLDERCPNAPADIVPLVAEMLAKEPALRPAAGEVASLCAALARAQ